MGQIMGTRVIVTAILCGGMFIGVIAHRTYRLTQTPLIPAALKLKLEPDRLVFDAVPMGGEATKTFSVTNTSGHPMRILGIHSSCGCTRVRFQAGLLQPQGQCVVSVSVSGTQRPSEAETAWLQVQTDDSEHAQYQLPVYVSDVVGARLSPSMLDFGVVSVSQNAPQKQVRLIWVGKAAVPTSAAQLRVDHPALFVSPPRPVEDGIAEFDIQLKSSEYVGSIFSNLAATNARGETIRGTITARIPTLVKFEPESLIFDRSRTGQVLIRLPREEFSNVSTTSEWVTASIAPEAMGDTVTVVVAAQEGLDWGNLSAVRCCLLVKFNRHGTLSIPVTIIPSTKS